MAEKLAPEKRHSFVNGGQKVFEWNQTLEEVDMYIDLPPNVPKKLFYCKIQSEHLEVGIKGNPSYLNHDLACPVKVDSSFWTLEDEVMHITLQKRDKGKNGHLPYLVKVYWIHMLLNLNRSALCFKGFKKRTLVLTFLKLSSAGPALIRGPSWVA